jgi:hypothetical protein
VEEGHRWCMWHHREGCVELKPKANGSMRLAASDTSTPTCHFVCIGPQGHRSLLLGPINRTLGGLGLLATSPIFVCISYIRESEP